MPEQFIEFEHNGKKFLKQLETAQSAAIIARASALKSVGYIVSREVSQYIDEGGRNWPEVHPLTRSYKSGRNGLMRRGQGHPGAYDFMKKYTRYRMDDKERRVDVNFGKSQRGKPGKFDAELAIISKQMQRGGRTRVTDRMTRLWGSTRERHPQRIGDGGFFPLRKDTSFLRLPKRDIFDTVFRRIRNKIITKFDERFTKRFDKEKP